MMTTTGSLIDDTSRYDMTTGNNLTGSSSNLRQNQYQSPQPLRYRPLTDAERQPKSTGMPEYVVGGINMTQIARGSHLTLGAISRIFNGTRKPHPNNLAAIATFLEITPEEVQVIIDARIKVYKAKKEVKVKEVEGQSRGRN